MGGAITGTIATIGEEFDMRVRIILVLALCLWPAVAQEALAGVQVPTEVHPDGSVAIS